VRLDERGRPLVDSKSLIRIANRALNRGVIPDMIATLALPGLYLRLGILRLSWQANTVPDQRPRNQCNNKPPLRVLNHNGSSFQNQLILCTRVIFIPESEYSIMKPSKKSITVLRFLKKNYSKHLAHGKPFEVTISCILSQRTREENTEKASRALFKAAKTPRNILAMPTRKIEKIIHSTGFYRQKARIIKKACRTIIETYDGKIPRTREELMTIPGIGYKCSNIILSYGFGKPAIAVDTHVNRISKRLGLAKERDDVEQVRETLEKAFPKRKWNILNLGFVNFGRTICLPRNPKCPTCPLNSICPYYREHYL